MRSGIEEDEAVGEITENQTESKDDHQITESKKEDIGIVSDRGILVLSS